MPRIGSMRGLLAARKKRAAAARSALSYAKARTAKLAKPRAHIAWVTASGYARAATAEGRARARSNEANRSLRKFENFRSSGVGKAIRIASSPRVAVRLAKRKKI